MVITVSSIKESLLVSMLSTYTNPVFGLETVLYVVYILAKVTHSHTGCFSLSKGTQMLLKKLHMSLFRSMKIYEIIAKKYQLLPFTFQT